MTPEELLRPRYKVIELYPFNRHFKAGEIIELNLLDDREHLKPEWYVNQPELTNTNSYGSFFNFHESYLNLYPHLFKKLEWWEDRDENDLPKYLRFKDNIWKVDKWVVDMIKQVYPTYKNDEGNDFLCIKWNFFKNEFSPATEDEYLNQNK